MNVPLLLQITVRLLVALVLGGFVGLERETHGRPAGFRTHILVALGSSLMMIVSAYGFQDMNINFDPGRIAAQVISGIGFLGAGTILREGANIRGLTTAASLWSVAGIGLAVGIGLYLPAIIATLLIVLTLFYLNRIELAHNVRTIRITALDRPGQVADILAVIGKHNININQIEMSNDNSGNANIELVLDVPKKEGIEKLLIDLNTLDEISKLAVE